MQLMQGESKRYGATETLGLACVYQLEVSGSFGERDVCLVNVPL
jgi:hypothetical protein